MRNGDTLLLNGEEVELKGTEFESDSGLPIAIVVPALAWDDRGVRVSWDELKPHIHHIEGQIKFVRGEEREGDSPCVCCDGGLHIHGMYIEVEPFPSIYAGLTVNSVDKWLDDWLGFYKLDGIENRRVRMTIEVLPEGERDEDMAQAKDEETG